MAILKFNMQMPTVKSMLKIGKMTEMFLFYKYVIFTFNTRSLSQGQYEIQVDNLTLYKVSLPQNQKKVLPEII